VHFFAGAVVQGARVLRGFGVRVTSNGAKAFVLDYRIRRRQHRYTIGTWPDWSAHRAVREARELRQRVDRGGPERQLSKAAVLGLGYQMGAKTFKET
jgi:hypothetical protein